MSYKNILFINALFSCLIFLGACGGERAIPKNKISNSNPTYLNINHDRIAEFIKWQDESYENIYFRRDEVKKPDYPLQVKLRQLKIKNFGAAPLFLLDTSSYNSSGYLAYTENPKYFGELTAARANFHSKERQIIGTYKQELLDLGLSYKDMAVVLMQFGVIGTYHHLYAEMIIDRKEDNPEFHEIHYDCVYHMCTSDCFDPKYKFSIRFDKELKQISITPK